jgi:hypothetical protein
MANSTPLSVDTTPAQPRSRRRGRSHFGAAKARWRNCRKFCGRTPIFMLDHLSQT